MTRTYRPIGECWICGGEGQFHFTELMEQQTPDPPILALMGGEPPYGAPGVVRCEICGTYYAYDYSCGFGEHDISLHWISPNEAEAPTDEPRYLRELESECPNARDYAAMALVDAWLAAGDRERVLGLMRHADAKVRTRAVVSVMYRVDDLTPYLPAFLERLFDENGTVRCNAARIKDYHRETLRAHRGQILDYFNSAGESAWTESVREVREFLNGQR